MSSMKKQNLITLLSMLFLGCAFGFSFFGAFYEEGWNIHLAFQLLACFLVGLTVRRLASTTDDFRIPFAVLLVMGSFFTITFHILNIWIGCRLGMLTSGQSMSVRKRSCYLFVFALGMLTTLIPNQQLGVEAIYIIGIYLLLPHPQASTSTVSDSKTIQSNIIPQIIYGMIIGSVFVGLWNQQTQVTQPQATHLLQAWICFIALSGVGKLLLPDAEYSSKIGWSFLWLPVLIWPFMGYGSVQPWDGETIIHGSIVLSGLLGLFLFRATSIQTGFALSLLLSTTLTDQITELHCITALSILWLLFEGFKPHTVLTLLIGGFCLFTDRGPVRPTIPTSRFVQFQNDNIFSVAQESWSNEGWIVVGQKNQMSKDVTISTQNIIFIENTPVNLPSRRWKNERDFGVFLRYLFPDVGQIAILNDISGQVNMAIGTAENIQVEVHTPNTTLTRLVANQYEDKKSHWLKPNRQIIESKGYHPQSGKDYDMVIESIHHPWPSSISNGFSKRHFEHLSRSLGESGIAAFIIHINEVQKHGMNVLASRLESTFKNTLYVLPKDNIDSILILCSRKKLEYSDLATSLSEDEDFWLGQIVLRSYPIHETDNVDLSPQNAPTVPLAHLTELKDYLPEPADLWKNLPTKEQQPLEEKFKDHKEYLTLLTAGMSGTLQTLQQTSLPAELTANLIEPHIQSAKKHIRLAQVEGQSSTHWSDAQRYVLTAQLIAPKDTEPWLLLGDIAIGQGFIEKAREKYRKALELDPSSIEAINGLARAAGLQGNASEVKSLLFKAKELEPGNWITTYNLATFMLQENEVETALNLFQSTLELPNGDNEKTRIGLVECYIATEKWTRGLLEIDRLVQTTASPTAVMWYLRGRIHFGLELWDKAEVDFRKAALEDPQFHAARGSIGLIKIAQGDLEGAAQAFRSTLRFDPNNETARKNLQQVLEQLNASQ